MEIVKKWYEYTSDEIQAIKDNKLSYVSSWLKTNDKITSTKMDLKNNEKYNHLSKLQIKNREKVIKLNTDLLIWINEKLNNCDLHLKAVYNE